MRTRMHQWLDMKRMKPAFGIQVWHKGRWLHAHEDGKPLIFKTEAACDAKRAALSNLNTTGEVKG